MVRLYRVKGIGLGFFSNGRLDTHGRDCALEVVRENHSSRMIIVGNWRGSAGSECETVTESGVGETRECK